MKTTQIYLTSRAKPTSVSAQLKGEAGGARLGHSCWASLALPARARGGPRLPQDHRVGRGGRTPCPSGPATKSRRNKNRQNPCSSSSKCLSVLLPQDFQVASCCLCHRVWCLCLWAQPSGMHTASQLPKLNHQTAGVIFSRLPMNPPHLNLSGGN